jgi:hypothetical protein
MKPAEVRDHTEHCEISTLPGLTYVALGEMKHTDVYALIFSYVDVGLESRAHVSRKLVPNVPLIGEAHD